MVIAMRKVLDKKTLEKEAELWSAVKKAVAAAPVRHCRK
jgi:hypothetical protein